MNEGQIWKHEQTGVRVAITKIEVSKATGLRWIHFVDRRGCVDFMYEHHFKMQYELHINTPT